MKLWVIVILAFFGHVVWAGCTPRAVTVCTTILYKGNLKTTECSTTYEWTCNDSTGGSGSGGSGSGGTGGTGSGSTGGGSSTPNIGNVADCMKSIVAFEFVQSEFGETGGGRSRSHTGIDLKCANGTKLYSPANGLVVAAIDGIPTDSNLLSDPPTSIGNMITIRVDDAYNANGDLKPGAVVHVVLDHLNPGLKVREGDRVSIGQELGETDNTGNSSSDPHLHLGIMANPSTGTGYVDPRTILSENCN